MEELTDTEIIKSLEPLGYFLAQGDYWGRAHVCKERDGYRALAICGQVCDGSAQPRKGAGLCRRCRRVIGSAVVAAKRDQQKLAKWQAVGE
jgi:hypothetical protein